MLAALPPAARATSCRPLTDLLYFACRDGQCRPLFRVAQRLNFHCQRRHVMDSVPPGIVDALQPALVALAGTSPADFEVQLIRWRWNPGQEDYDSAAIAQARVLPLPESGTGSLEAERRRYTAQAADELRAWRRRRALEALLAVVSAGLLFWSCRTIMSQAGDQRRAARLPAAVAIQIALFVYAVSSVGGPNNPPSVRIAALVVLVAIFELARSVGRRLRGAHI